MKTNYSTYKTPTEIASDIFQETKVESAFDKKGEFSFLLAKLPKDEFTKLYSINTTVTIFINGFWFQMSLLRQNKYIYNRETKTFFKINIFVNNFEFTILEIIYKGKISKFRFKKLSYIDLLYTTEGYYSLAKAAAKIFFKINNNFNNQYSSSEYFPVIQIIPDDFNNQYFNSSLVDIQ